MRCSLEEPIGRNSMSPCPSSDSAPPPSRITRESCCEDTANAMRAGTLTLIVPVMMSTDGRCVASTRWMPTARDFCARRMIESSTSAGATIIRSASSSITHRMYGQRRLAGRGAGAVQLDDVAGARLPHHLVAVLHLADQVGEHVRRHARHVHDRRQQVRDVLVVVELDALRVDQHHPHLVRASTRIRIDDSIVLMQPDFPEPVVPATEQVRHAREVGPHGVARDVLAEPHGQRRAAAGLAVLLAQLAAEDVAEVDHAVALVGHLHADRLLAGNRSEDADVGGGERVGDVVLQLGDLRDLGAGREPQLVARDARAGDLADELGLDAEVAERLHQRAGDLVLVGGVGPLALRRSGAAAWARAACS